MSHIPPHHTQANSKVLPPLDEGTSEMVNNDTVLLMQIKQKVETTMRKYIAPPTPLNNKDVSRYVDLIFQNIKEVVRVNPKAPQ